MKTLASGQHLAVENSTRKKKSLICKENSQNFKKIILRKKFKRLLVRSVIIMIIIMNDNDTVYYTPHIDQTKPNNKQSFKLLAPRMNPN